MGTPVNGSDLEYMGNQLKELRRSRGFRNQEIFGEYLGLSKDTISNYERGNTAIPHDIIRKICTEFHVSADYLYFDKDTLLIVRERGEDNDVDKILMEKIDQCDEFRRKQLIDIADILLRQRPAMQI